MVVAPSIITVAKYGFLSLIVTSAGLLIGNIIVVKHHTEPEFADSLVYNEQSSFGKDDFRLVLDRNFGRCLIEPSRSFCLMSDKKRLLQLRSKEQSQELENVPGPPPTNNSTEDSNPINRLLVEFGKVMKSLNATPVLLEPSMLYCLVSPSNKLNLIKKGFNPYKFQGSSKVVTVGIFDKDSKVIDQELAMSALFSAGYNISRSRRWLNISEKSNTIDYYGTVHYFFSKRGLTIHGAVLFERHNFLWNAGIRREEFGFKDLLFATESTFENFTAVPLNIEKSPELKISIPSSPVRFLYEIPLLGFLECSGKASNEVPFAHPWLTPLQLRNRARVSIQELKALFYPHFIPFWLWMETLTGWNEDCNIYSRTFEMNLAISHMAARGTNLTSVLTQNDYLKILPDIRLGNESTIEDIVTKIALDCYGLKINIFFCFEEKNSVWSYFSTEEGSAYRVVRPKFHLCTAEVYGLRVHVPCETKPEVILKISERNTL